jgi:site-specific DNA-methyltransferase (adenine-specific)
MPKIELYNLDCMPEMAKMKDKEFELAIVDPPYGIGEDGASNHSRGCLAQTTKFSPKQWDRDKPSSRYFEELFRVSQNQIIWGANHFGNFPGSSCWVVWDKQNGATDFADCELAYTSFNTAVRKCSLRWQGMLQHDMKNKEVRIHPTQKPVRLYQWLLLNYAKPGDRILDTHGGSLSSVIAAIIAGYSITAYEIDEEYFKKGCERVIKFARQGDMLREQPEIIINGDTQIC